jgi:hypothetical protein
MTMRSVRDRFTISAVTVTTTRKRPIAANIIVGAPTKMPAGAKYYRRAIFGRASDDPIPSAQEKLVRWG